MTVFGPGVVIDGPIDPVVLTPDAVAFIVKLQRRFGPTIIELLCQRKDRRQEFDAGKLPDFLPETAHIREGRWTADDLPHELTDRKVELTGPVDAKTIINGMNSAVHVFMADFEDSLSPSWANVIQGQRNLMGAVRRTLEYRDPLAMKSYSMGVLMPREQETILMVRPRGLHLPERHMEVDDLVVCAPLFDFGLFFFHNAQELVRVGSGPYFYIPKLESHLEARLWNDVFLFAQAELGLPFGTIKATVLIETLPAAFEMDEMIWELRQHIAGLNCGRWDYIFSFIKTRSQDPDAVMPDRLELTMDKGFLDAYSHLLVKTCHRRRILAMGGMSAYIPIKDDLTRNALALVKVGEDKAREAKMGFDGTWVAHPGLVLTALDMFAAYGKKYAVALGGALEASGPTISAQDLLVVPPGPKTETCLRHNIRVAIRYMATWLSGKGCVPLYDLMEDAATAEISRAQVWQWLHHGVALDTGITLTRDVLLYIISDEMTVIEREVGTIVFTIGAYEEARRLFEQMVVSSQLDDFMTLLMYERLPT